MIAVLDLWARVFSLGRFLRACLRQQKSRSWRQVSEYRSFSSLVSHLETARSDQFEIMIVISNRLRLKFVVGHCVQGSLLLSLGVGDDQQSAGASQAQAGQQYPQGALRQETQSLKEADIYGCSFPATLEDA